MTDAKPLVLQTEELEPNAQDFLRQRCDFRVVRWDSPEFAELLPHAEGLVVRTYTKIDRDLLDRAANLRVVGRAGVGLDNIDLQACQAAGVRVVHTPGANTAAVAELVAAFLLDAYRPRVFLTTPLDAPRWAAARDELTAPRGLSSITLGVLGMGRIGQAVARVAHAFGARVIYTDLEDRGQAHGERVSLNTLLSTADAITVHADPRPTNHRLLGEREFARLKPDAVFINTARGFLVDPFALADFLLANPGAQAILDVHDPEPFDATYPLLDLPNAHLAPHLGSCVQDAKVRMSWVVRDVWRVLTGEPPEHEASP